MTIVCCGSCDAVLAETVEQVDRPPCPKCGSAERLVKVRDSDQLDIELKEKVKLKAKDPLRTGKRKILFERVVGDELCVSSGVWLSKDRLIDKENNWYFELVTDPETGQVIHRCAEPLSKHRGHGSAKQPKKNVG